MSDKKLLEAYWSKINALSAEYSKSMMCQAKELHAEIVKRGLTV